MGSEGLYQLRICWLNLRVLGRCMACLYNVDNGMKFVSKSFQLVGEAITEEPTCYGQRRNLAFLVDHDVESVSMYLSTLCLYCCM